MKGCCARALHVERGAEGFWQQRAAFSHADLHEELVSEPLPSPFALHHHEGTFCYTFLLLGDQNAGKSTFLHAFTHEADASWLSLVSLLPIISSSFLNASLLPSSEAPPMDEPPFIDTDIGKL